MPNPDGSQTAAERAAQVAADAAANAGSSSAASTEDLDKWLRENGIPVPQTKADLMVVAQQLRDQIDAFNQAYPNGPMTGGGVLGTIGYGVARKNIQNLQDQLIGMAEELWPSAYGQGSTAQQVSYVLRPPAPSIEKLPTAEEFLGDYQNAFSTQVSDLRASGQLTSQEADFATNQLQSKFLQMYTGKMGDLAKSGVSPYTLGEVTREQRGTASGTPAGNALDAAYGTGVTTPTTLTGTSADVTAQTGEIGTGVAQEFTSQPVIKPLDFLQQTMTAASIKLAYAGSQYGAGKPVYGAAPAGWVSGPRRA